jgi:hypothetical protein
VEFHATAGRSVGLGDDEGDGVASGDDGFEGGDGEFGGAAEDETQDFPQKGALNY